MKLLRHPAAHWILAALVGGVFVYASVSKIDQPREFAKIVYHYQVIGPSQSLGFVPANLLAVTLPWIELLTGIALMVNFWRREAALVAGGMLAVFVAAVASALARGIDIQNCGCFSMDAAGRAAGWGLIAGDLALLAACAVVALAPVRREDAVAEAAALTAH